MEQPCEARVTRGWRPALFVRFLPKRIEVRIEGLDGKPRIIVRRPADVRATGTLEAQIAERRPA